MVRLINILKVSVTSFAWPNWARAKLKFLFHPTIKYKSLAREALSITFLTVKLITCIEVHVSELSTFAACIRDATLKKSEEHLQPSKFRKRECFNSCTESKRRLTALYGEVT